MIEAIENSTRIIATTTSTAVVESLKIMGLKRLSVGAPYPDSIMDKLKDFLEKNGVEVVKIKVSWKRGEENIVDFECRFADSSWNLDEFSKKSA